MKKYKLGDAISIGDEYFDGKDYLIVRNKLNGRVYWLFKTTGYAGEIYEEGFAQHLCAHGYWLTNGKEALFSKLYKTLKQ